MNHERKFGDVSLDDYRELIGQVDKDVRAAVFLAEKARAWRMATRYFWIISLLGAVIGNVIGVFISRWLFN